MTEYPGPCRRNKQAKTVLEIKNFDYMLLFFGQNLSYFSGILKKNNP